MYFPKKEEKEEEETHNKPAARTRNYEFHLI